MYIKHNINMSFKHYTFNDEKRIVDYVLKYDNLVKPKKPEFRQNFLNNLIKAGLEYEEEKEHNYIKIHVPKNVLYKYCDALKIKVPLKDGIVNLTYKQKKTCWEFFLFFARYQMDALPITNFHQGRLDLFNVDDENFFVPLIRSFIVNTILNKIMFSEDKTDIGLELVIAEKIFLAAFPLHDGSIHDSPENSVRCYLLHNWASFKKMFHPQPFKEIKEYCGVKVTLYFIWLAFYTFMLIPPSIIGILIFIYGISGIDSDEYSNDICNSEYIMCPQCDLECDFWKLSNTCFYAKLTRAIDNKLTIAFSVFMSLWSAMYLKLWKRYSAEIVHFWGLHDYRIEDEIPRVNYQRKLRKRGKVSFWRHRCPGVTISYGFVISLILLPAIAILSITFYKLYVVYATKTSPYNRFFQNILIPITASTLQLISICVSSEVYKFMSVKLTEIEYQRTETEFNDSLNIKIYLFEFFNNYSSIFYIAFMKGKLIGHPGQYIRILGGRQQECDAGGCFIELFIQLFIIMSGKQLLGSLVETLSPFVKRRAKIKKHHSKVDVEKSDGLHKQVEDDFQLDPWSSSDLAPEYLEMVIQYGFVTMFAVTFPFAPLLALINNLFEIRSDAMKLLRFFRKPVECRAKDIGVWGEIIHAVSVISLITNALIIAFTTNFVPKLIYYVFQPSYADRFLDFTLSDFLVEDLEVLPEVSEYNVTTCKYVDLRYPYWHLKKYELSFFYFLITAAKLGFVFIYQNILYVILSGLYFVIPDTPKKVTRWIIQEEKGLTNFLISRNQEEIRKLSKDQEEIIANE